MVRSRRRSESFDHKLEEIRVSIQRHPDMECRNCKKPFFNFFKNIHECTFLGKGDLTTFDLYVCKVLLNTEKMEMTIQPEKAAASVSHEM